jgi:hypothetical protein
LSRGSLMDRTCTTLLANGLDRLSNEELAAAPDLNPKLDADACHPPSLWARLRELFLGSSSNEQPGPGFFFLPCGTRGRCRAQRSDARRRGRDDPT